MGKAKEIPEIRNRAELGHTIPTHAGAVFAKQVDILDGARRAQPGEPEDAYLTGDRRSLRRRLLGLNLPEVRVAAFRTKPAVAVPIGAAASMLVTKGDGLAQASASAIQGMRRKPDAHDRLPA